MILVFKVLAAIFMLIGINFTIVILVLAIQGRIERKRAAKYYDFDEDEMNNLEMHNKQLDIMSRDLEEYLSEKYGMNNPEIEIPDECVGCVFGKRFVNDGDEDNILVCLQCRRTYVEGSECWSEYPDRYITEEEE